MWTVLKAKSGVNTLCYNHKPFHSLVDPQKEADGFIQKTFITQSYSRWNIILGVGLGYHVDCLYKKLQGIFKENFTILCVFSSKQEQDFFFQSFPKYWENPHCLYVIGGQNNKLEQFFELFFSHTIHLDEMRIIEYFVITQSFPEIFREVKQKLQEFFSYGIQNFATTLEFNLMWIRNMLGNLKYVALQWNYYKITGDVILVSAGFSVQKNLAYLKNQKGKTPIAAVDTILPTLLIEGIVPDIVIACDGQIDNYYDFFVLMLDARKHTEIVLLGDITQYFKIGALFSQVQLSFSGNMIEAWKEYFFQEIPSCQKLPSGGSVASFALAALYQLGASRILLVGQDLQNRPLSHAVSTIHHSRQIFNSNRLFPFWSFLKKWLQQPSNIFSQDRMLQNLTRWIGDFFKIFPVEGLQKDPSVPIDNVKIWSGESLNGSLVFSEMEKKPTRLKQKLEDLLVWIEGWLQINNYEHWKEKEQQLELLERKMLEECLIKVNLYRDRRKDFRGDIYIKWAKKNLSQIRKWILREIKEF